MSGYKDMLDHLEYEEFKQRVILDECKNCGTTKNLTIHHKKKQSNYPHLKYKPENCIVLCNACHRRIHK